MDNVTHTLTALALSRAGLNRVSPRAGWILVVAANAADLDILFRSRGLIEYLNYHRQATHSWPAVPLVAALAVLLVRLAGRRPLPWLRAYAVALAGAATHPLLDWCNVYGVRWLAPFSDQWFHGDIFYVVDVCLWVALIAAFAAPAISRLVSSEIGARPAPGRWAAIAALCFFALYGMARWQLHERAIAVLDSRVYPGGVPLRVAAFPGPLNPFRWTGLVEGETYYTLYSVDLLGEFDPMAGRTLFKHEPDPALEAARRTRFFQDYLRFARYPYWRVTPIDDPEGGRKVEVMDLRFGIARFMATAIVDDKLEVRRTWFAFGAPSRR